MIVYCRTKGRRSPPHYWRILGRLLTHGTARRETCPSGQNCRCLPKRSCWSAFMISPAMAATPRKPSHNKCSPPCLAIFALTGRILADAGGRLFKAMGDDGLAAFPAELVDAGVLAFQMVQREGQNWLAERGYKSRVIVKLHLGPVAIGLVGSPGKEILDLY